ncbi:hypothetical protein EMCRGX_G006657 [Ephydatia muelleri]
MIVLFDFEKASDASLCSSYHNYAFRRFEISCSSSNLNNATCYVDTESNSCNGVFIIRSGFNYSFWFCGVKPLVVQCQETTDYSQTGT